MQDNECIQGIVFNQVSNAKLKNDLSSFRWRWAIEMCGWKVECWSWFSSEFRDCTSNFPRPSCLGLDSFNPVSPFVHSSNCRLSSTPEFTPKFILSLKSKVGCADQKRRDRIIGEPTHYYIGHLSIYLSPISHILWIGQW